MGGQAKAERSKSWCVILYPEDLPDDWQTLLQQLGVKTVISPLHDKDFNADGSPKKPHHHIILLFGSKKSAQQVTDMFAQCYGTSASGSICGVANISAACIVHCQQAAVRYLCHLDNPEKAQYETADIIGLNGADVTKLLARSMQEMQDLLGEILDFIEDNDITEFYDLARIAKEVNSEWFLIISTKSTVFLNHYIRSRRHARQAEEARETSEATSEETSEENKP